MAYTAINSEDRFVQATFAEHLEQVFGWKSVCAWNDEAFGPGGIQRGANVKASACSAVRSVSTASSLSPSRVGWSNLMTIRRHFTTAPSSVVTGPSSGVSVTVCSQT